RDGERGAALNAAIEPDHGSLVRTALRRDDLGGLTVDVERRARCKRVSTLARAFDEEGAVEPVRAPDETHRHEVRRRRQVSRRRRLPPRAARTATPRGSRPFPPRTR